MIGRLKSLFLTYKQFINPANQSENLKMETHIKSKKELLIEAQKEQQLAKLFNQCLQLMDAVYRKQHQSSCKQAREF